MARPLPTIGKGSGNFDRFLNRTIPNRVHLHDRATDRKVLACLMKFGIGHLGATILTLRYIHLRELLFQPLVSVGNSR